MIHPDSVKQWEAQDDAFRAEINCLRARIAELERERRGWRWLVNSNLTIDMEHNGDHWLVVELHSSGRKDVHEAFESKDEAEELMLQLAVARAEAEGEA